MDVKLYLLITLPQIPVAVLLNPQSSNTQKKHTQRIPGELCL